MDSNSLRLFSTLYNGDYIYLNTAVAAIEKMSIWLIGSFYACYDLISSLHKNQVKEFLYY